MFSIGTLIREDIKIINSWLMDDNEENGANAHLPKDDALDM